LLFTKTGVFSIFGKLENLTAAEKLEVNEEATTFIYFHGFYFKRAHIYDTEKW
jgi:hypothetical protein